MLGYAMGDHHDAALVIASLQMAAVTRGGTVDGVIFHTDRGSEYTAADFAAACRALGRRPVDGPGRVRARQRRRRVVQLHPQGRVRPPSTTSTTRAEARIKIATWIADFYNTRRRHTATDGLPPIVYSSRSYRASSHQGEVSGDHRRITESPRFQGMAEAATQDEKCS